ncbi:MAG: bifunctional serine/threonine-protein kinase/formylglycine-generating enzyme family protein [Rhodospirillaceae bacterium]
MADDHDNWGLPAGFLLKDRFLIERALAYSGFNIIYKALDTEMDRYIALKEFFPRQYVMRCSNGGQPEVVPLSGEHAEAYLCGLKNFQNEAQALAHVRHPNVVTVYDRINEAHGTAFLVMELIEGLSLRALVTERGPLRTESAVRDILDPMMSALEAVHRLGLIHRDVKPANIIVRAQDGLPVLLDFGIARASNAIRFTVALTPGYAPPEQYAEDTAQGPYTDIYGLAAVAWFLMTGTVPVGANSRLLALHRHRRDPLPRIKDVIEDTPFPFSPELVAAVEAGMAVDCDQRPQTISDWRLRFENKKRVSSSNTKLALEPGCIFRDRTRSGTTNNEFPEMVVLPPGRFLMGTAPGEEEREGIPKVLRGRATPQHGVTIDNPLALGRLPVTRGQFREFLRNAGWHTIEEGAYVFTGGSWERKEKGGWQSPGFEQTDDHPVVCANWFDAQAYVRWLSHETGEEYRLPSEAEWEYSCRALSTTTRYWGNDIDTMVKYAQTYNETTRNAFPGLKSAMIAPGRTEYRHTAPAGSLCPNGFDLCDMLGNVWEWCEDSWTDSYCNTPTDGQPYISPDCASRVLRGGSWLNLPTYVRSAYRGRCLPSLRYLNFGFRVARNIW